jgi:hypothetical protein
MTAVRQPRMSQYGTAYLVSFSYPPPPKTDILAGFVASSGRAPISVTVPVRSVMRIISP